MTMKQGKKGNKDKSVYKVTTLALASLLYWSRLGSWKQGKGEGK
jgi:hypothetical protein